jgi:hypothetical protein
MSDSMPEKKSELLPILNAFPTRSETLVLRAEALFNLGGEERLDAEERRDALQYLLLMRPDLNLIELGRYFKVTEKVIRSDKDIIRKRISEEVTDKDISVVVSDIMRGQELLRTDLARSKKKCALGTPTYVNHLKFEQECEHKYIELLQSLGVYPKNLGNITRTEFIYKAHVAKGGGVSVSTIQSDAELKTIEAQEVKLLPGAYETDEDRNIRSALATEFSDAAPSKEPVTPAASTPMRVLRG